MEYCNICDRKCDGAYCILSKEKRKEKLINDIVKLILSQDKEIIDEIIKRINPYL